jgi:hypothetical protein
MADWDPNTAGGVPWNPATAGGAPVGQSAASPASPSGIARPATTDGAPVAAGMPPGFEATTAAAAAQQTAMTTRAQSYANDMFPLFKAQEALTAAPTGKVSEPGYQAGAILQTYAPEWLHRTIAFGSTLGGALGGIMTPEQTAAYAEANKYLTQVQLGVSGATRSNEGGQTASAASPSVDIPKPAAQAVLQNMIGLRRMEQDQTMQWQQSGLPVQALPGFVSKFQTNVDPRIYVWDQLPKAQQTKILDTMPAHQKPAFLRKLQAADQNGIFNTMGMGAPPQ